MSLPLSPPISPQLALARKTLPVNDGYVYEIKLDGFRCIAFVDGEDAFLQSRNGRSLSRYFPELKLPYGRYVLDGEIVIRGADGSEDFDALSQRIHPAASRVSMLAAQTPSVYVAFDLLALDDKLLLKAPFTQRRAALTGLLEQAGAHTEEGAGAYTVKAADTRAQGSASIDAPAAAPHPLELMSAVETAAEAERWLQGAEGVIAKERDAPYTPGKRAGMVKVKRIRTIDAVLVGWRPGKAQGTVGALILGLYDGDDLRTVGHCSGLTAESKRELVGRLAPYQTGAHGTAEPSRWSAGRDLQWVALRPQLVVEVSFDHVSAGRIRHGAKLLRWRQDKDPKDCTIDQLAA